jgi:alpha-amylase/alpha-mannosidase (GH57 family)
MSHTTLNVAFLWHQHQPYYKNFNGVYNMPWVRFHGTKDYLDMLLTLKEFPRIKQNFNLVPSLLLQIQDYVENEVKDNIWILTEIPANRLSIEEKEAILENFFLANVQYMIKPYKRFYELYLKYRYESPYTTVKERTGNFEEQDYRDLQIWYNLTWIGQVSRERPAIQALFEKERNFSEEDKIILFEETRAILREIVPLHKELWDAGQIELSTSPFYHPILPLLINSSVAKESNPECILPQNTFIHPEDADTQLRKGLAYFEELFGRKTAGIWPSEGSVSADTVQLIARHNIHWIATDEAILAKSLKEKFHSNRIYQPHLFHDSAKTIYIFFRDHYLSDTIGFVYNNWPEDRAVDDFVTRLHAIRQRIIEESGEDALRSHIVSIILDGENCWEHYPDDGRPFMRKLYRRISEDELLKTVTFSEFLENKPETPNLYSLHPGSWINSNYNIWIGAEEDNRAWDLLKEVRDFLAAREKEGILTHDQLAEAWEQIYIAEGSDWCWWYGDDHSSSHDLEFDQLFREHLMKVYEIAGEEIPAALYQTIKHTHFDRFASIRPLNFITPLIDGKISHFYEWVGAAVYDGSKTTQTAMHQVSRIIDKFYLGFDREHFYFRIDFFHKPDLLYEFVFSAKTPRQTTVVFSPLRGVIEKFEHHLESIENILLNPTFKLGEIFEAALSFKDLGLQKGELFGFQLIIKQNGQQVEIFPHTKIIEIEIPGDDYEFREWSV